MSFKDVLRIRSFRDLWLGQAISQMGDSIYYVSFMFMTQQITGSFAMVGFVGAMETLPYLLFGAYAGVVADRHDRRRIMLYSDLACASILLGYATYAAAHLGRVPTWALLLIPFALSTVRVFFMPAKSAAIPNLVPSEMLTKANALSSTTFNFVGLAGLAFAATIIAKVYAVAPESFFAVLLALNALSFAGSAFFIVRLPEILPDREHEEPKHPWDDFKSGLRFVRRRRDLSMLIVLQAAFRIGLAPFFVAYVAANAAWFGGRPNTLMWLEFTFFAGMILGSYLAGKWKVHRPTMVFSAELVMIGLLVGCMAIPSLIGFAILNFLCGLVVAAGDIPITTYLQVSVEDGFRGRVSSVRDMITAGVMPIGMSLGGIMLARLGVTGSFIAMGIVMTIAGAAGFIDRQYRNVQMPAEAFTNDPGFKLQDSGATA